MSDRDNRPDQATWSDVDKAAEPAAFAQYLDTIRTLHAIEAYKVRSVEMMRLEAGMSALDVGCGTGDDTKRLLARVGPAGRVHGVDFSAAMVEESTRRWADTGEPVTFSVGDVHALALPTDGFDAVRADRVFQHVADPRAALAELVRVTRPGGRVVLSDPDWGTYIMDADPTPAVLRYLEFAQRQARNPWIGRQFYGIFREAGLEDIEVDVTVAVLLDRAVLEKLGNLDAGFLAAVAAGQMTEAEVAEVKAELEARQAARRFFVTVNLYTASGTVPG